MAQVGLRPPIQTYARLFFGSTFWAMGSFYASAEGPAKATIYAQLAALCPQPEQGTLTHLRKKRLVLATEKGLLHMLAIISPAKKLKTSGREVHTTQPMLMDQAEYLAAIMRQKGPGDLRELMGISQNLAELNVERYQLFTTPFSRENAEPAALMFAGDTYVGLAADSLSDDDLEFAQGRLGILSGLYGILRPLDLAQPYRLEMGTPLANERGSDLYTYWGSQITELINGLTEGHTDRSVVNLASKEYFSSVKVNELAGPVITPVFKELRAGRAKVISFLAKRARGAMARFIIRHRLESPKDLRDFNEDGYEYQASISTPTELVFHRADTGQAS